MWILGIDNGSIININDTFGLKIPMNPERPASPAYICSKFALTALTECLRLELAQLESNIKVIVSISMLNALNVYIYCVNVYIYIKYFTNILKIYMYIYKNTYKKGIF